MAKTATIKRNGVSDIDYPFYAGWSILFLHWQLMMLPLTTQFYFRSSCSSHDQAAHQVLGCVDMLLWWGKEQQDTVLMEYVETLIN